jgi:protein tyrosine/serine phosphatase
MSSIEWPAELAGYVNFRDLGGHTTPHGVTVSGRIFRSDSLAHAGDEHVEHLVEERGVRTVVDLRGEQEVEAFPNQPMADAGVTLHHVPLIDPAARRRSSEAGEGAERSEGYDWKNMTLVDLYQFIVRDSGPRFVEVLRVICNPDNHPLVFHCAAGKDRAGLIAATVLGLLEVPDDEIVDDYALTAAALDGLYARAHARAGATGTPPNDRFMTAEAETMREVLAWWHEQYGTVEQYMLGHGLTQDEIDTLRAAMIAP